VNSSTTTTTTTTTSNADRTPTTIADRIVPQKVLAALPSHKSVYKRYLDDPTTATASAALLSLHTSTSSSDALSKILTTVSELANDTENRSADPPSSAITLLSWAAAMAEVYRVISTTTTDSDGEGGRAEAVTHTINTVLEWREELDRPDTAYLALAAFLLSLPPTMSHQISTAGQILTDAHANGGFDDVGTACSALPILARKMVRCDSFTSIGATVGVLEREVVDSGAAGDLCFEAGLGLGIIAQAMAESEAASKRNDLVEMVRRIVAVLVGELRKCFVVECRCLRGVVDGVRAGRASKDLLRLCGRVESGDFVVQDGCRRAIVSLYIALSLSKCPLR